MPYVGGGMLYSDRTVGTGRVVSAVFRMRVVGYNIMIGLYVLVEVLCLVCGL